jgi:hypothetical protein
MKESVMMKMRGERCQIATMERTMAAGKKKKTISGLQSLLMPCGKDD